MNDIERLKYKDDDESVEIHLELFPQFNELLPWWSFIEQCSKAGNKWNESHLYAWNSIQKSVNPSHCNWNDAEISYNHNTYYDNINDTNLI